VTVRMRPDQNRAIDPEELRAQVMAAADPSSGLEHAYAEQVGAGIVVSLWMPAPSLAAAESAAMRLCADLADTVLTGYIVDSCRVELNAALAEAFLQVDEE
jgi:hypothetical protein